MASAMKAPTALADHHSDVRRGCSSRVQYCEMRIVRMGDMQDSKTPRKTRLTQSFAKSFVNAVVHAVRPHRKIITPKYRPL